MIKDVITKTTIENDRVYNIKIFSRAFQDYAVFESFHNKLLKIAKRLEFSSMIVKYNIYKGEFGKRPNI